MAKTKISEFDATAANNTDINGINIAEGCAPSGINNAIRQLMADLKEQQTGTSGDNFSVGGNLAVTGTSTFTGTITGPTPSVTDDSTKLATTAFVRDIIPTGVIVMWSGSIASVPTGWLLCDGANGTPNLCDRFIVGAGSTYAVNATGGSADAVVVDHTHTGTTNGGGSHTHTLSGYAALGGSTSLGIYSNGVRTDNSNTMSTAPNHTHTFTTGSSGVSGVNANLPPYFALAYIIKS